MKKMHVMLFLAISATGLLLAGCQQPAVPATPASHEAPVAQTTKGTVNITPSAKKDDVKGSVTIAKPKTLETSGSVSITKPEDGAEAAANKALEKAKGSVK